MKISRLSDKDMVDTRVLETSRKALLMAKTKKALNGYQQTLCYNPEESTGGIWSL